MADLKPAQLFSINLQSVFIRQQAAAAVKVLDGAWEFWYRITAANKLADGMGEIESLRGASLFGRAYGLIQHDRYLTSADAERQKQQAQAKARHAVKTREVRQRFYLIDTAASR